MFIAIAFPNSAREDGAVLLYLGLNRGEMLAQCDEAAKTGKFQRIGTLQRPVFHKFHLGAIRFEKTDCSPEHNAGLLAQRGHLAQGGSEADAALKGAIVKLDACKATLARLEAAAKKAIAEVNNLPKVPLNSQMKAARARIEAQAEMAAKAVEAAKAALDAAAAEAKTKADAAEVCQSAEKTEDAGGKAKAGKKEKK